MTYTPIEQVVSEFLDEINGGQAEFSRAYRIALRGVRELTFDVTGEVQNSRLSLNCDHTANLPEGCIKVIKIGHLSPHGEIIALRENNDLSVGDYHGHTRDRLDGFNNYLGYKDNLDYIGNLSLEGSYFTTFHHSLGVGSYSNRGDYKIQDGVVYFGAHLHGHELVVEYLGLPQVDGKLGIHPFASEALVAWIRYYWNIGRKDVSLGEKQTYKMEMKRAFTLAKNRVQSPTKQELNQYARQSVKGGLKA